MIRLKPSVLAPFFMLMVLYGCDGNVAEDKPSVDSANMVNTANVAPSSIDYTSAMQLHQMAGVEINYVAPPPDIYQPTKVPEWAKERDLKSIREHAWRIWGGITERTGQAYPAKSECVAQADLAVWDTWYSEAETFQRETKCEDGQACREFHIPRQTGGTEVLSFNKYSQEFLTWVDQNAFYDESTFIEMNKEMTKNNTPTKDRIIGAIPPDSATMLKPTFWVVKSDEPAMMPYWEGPHLDINGTLNPDRPVVSTWTSFVLFDPTGEADPNKKYPVEILGPNGIEKHMVKPKKVVNAADFYAVPLTQSDVDYIKNGNIFTIGGLAPDQLAPCDLALLVGMHVTTAEFDNWTWQTFWWSPFPEDSNQPTVKPPFTHFNVATAYYFDDAAGNPHIAFNPYLEPPIEGPIFMNPSDHGSHSNCMTCHHAAAYPTPNRSANPGEMLQGAYKATGEITGAEQWFGDRVKTRFMWGMLMEAQMQGKR